ncbi:hypothetical protein GCM10025794_29370 [Massilia kyonggiensis]|jgi:hypothetical protein
MNIGKKTNTMIGERVFGRLLVIELLSDMESDTLKSSIVIKYMGW